MIDDGSDPKHQLPVGLAAALRADALRKSEREEEFWAGQRARIRARARTHKAPRFLSLRLALASATILFFAILLTSPAGQAPQPVPQAAIDADQQLLVAVEHALASGTPEALEPLTLLVESSSNFNEAQGLPHKEHRNED